MKARDIMTSHVISVHRDTPAHEVAQLLLANGISAVPVVDEAGTPIGMVSEGDLIGRNEVDREARRDWWLALLAEGEELNADFLAGLRAPERLAESIMSAPVVSVGEDTQVSEIARVLSDYRIKRVPVVRDGRVTGIISRADLLRALVDESRAAAAPNRPGVLSSAIAELDDLFAHQRRSRNAAAENPQAASENADGLMADDFRHLMADFEHKEMQHRDELRRAQAERRKHRVVELIDQHIADDAWRRLLHAAREAAEHGQKEYMLLRFPSQLCTDRGRAINITEEGWPATLRGEAAEIYLRWERDLKPHGFHLIARILDYPGGVPGDVGLFLIWGQ